MSGPECALCLFSSSTYWPIFLESTFFLLSTAILESSETNLCLFSWSLQPLADSQQLANAMLILLITIYLVHSRVPDTKKVLDKYLLNELSPLLAYEPGTVPALKEWRIGGR